MKMTEQEIKESLLAFADKESNGTGKYPYAFGFVFATLNKKQLNEIEKFLQKENAK